MKKTTILILIILASGLIIYQKYKTPNYIKINHAESVRCYNDLKIDKNIICD